MTGLRVIVVTPEVPDPFGNAAARWFYALAKGLAEKQHRPRFFCAYPSSTPDTSLDRARSLFSSISVPLRLYPYPKRQWLRRKWQTLTRPYSFFLSDELESDVKRSVASGYDILNLDQMWTGYLGEGIKRAILTVHHLEILDLAGVYSTSVRFLASKHLMQLAERRLLSQCSNIRATTERLARVVTGLSPKARVFTAPVALDPTLYSFSQTSNSMTLGLIANMGWYPGFNAAVRLLDRIWPKVKSKVPEAELLLVGWKARQALANYLNIPNVTVIEDVPDTETFFRRLSVLTYPLVQGSGMKIKLLEAMAYGTPMVTTTEGAEGLSITDGQEAFISDDDDEFVEKTILLLRDRVLAHRLTGSARALLERDYSPEPVVSQMESIYAQVLNGNG